MKNSLQLKLSQHLTLTPQLQQSIKLLQLSTVEMNQELERYLLENPLLERVELAGDGDQLPAAANSDSGDENTSDRSEFAADYQANGQPSTNDPGAQRDAPRDTPGDGHGDEQGAASESADSRHDDADFGGDDGANYSSPSERTRNNDNNDDDEGGFGQIAAAEPTLQEHLSSQLALMSLSEKDRQLVLLLIAHLDEDGYLTHDIAELSAMIAEHIALDEDDLSIALKYLQNFEPTGVGARSLAECLQLQLRLMPKSTPFLDKALQLAELHLDLLGARDFLKLKRQLRVNDDELKQIRELIVALEPKPGRRFAQEDIRYVVADVVVKKLQGKWQAMLNQEAMPKLRVNKLYADLLHKSRDAEGKNLSGQLQEARWLIKNIQQRFDTILRVTQAIVERQKHFFEHGEVAMRPLVLREIADQVGLHESTISRVTTQKYMLTPRGIFELKYFFGSSVATDTGGACSATAIRALIKQLVQGEDQKKPLSDHKISDILSRQGILVARRTVAKYREGMNIQPANLRKSI